MEPDVLQLPADGQVPNNVLPVLVYREAGPADAAGMLGLFDRNGWRGGWRNGIYPFHHFHSTAHEVLGVTAGEVVVRLGGESGRDVTLRTGDVVVLPAGTGHKRVSDRGGLEVVGAYPDGRSWDLIRADEVTPEVRDRALRAIAAVPLPSSDPVAGRAGPLTRLWTQETG